MHTSPATQFLSPHAKGAPASWAHAPPHVQLPVLGSHVAKHLQLTGHAQGGGGPLQKGGGHGGVGGHMNCPLTQISEKRPLQPKQTSGPRSPGTHVPPELEPLVLPLDETPDDPVDPDELDAPEDDAPEDDAPEDDAPEDDAPEDDPELPSPELEEEPGTGTTLPPHATRSRVTTATITRLRVERMPAAKHDACRRGNDVRTATCMIEVVPRGTSTAPALPVRP